MKGELSMSQNIEIKALTDATISSIKSANQIDTAEQEKLKQQQEDILNCIAEYLVDYLKPLLEIRKLLTSVYYNCHTFKINWCFNELLIDANNKTREYSSFSVDNNSEYIRILYFYDSDKFVVDTNDDSSELFDEFLKNWESIKNAIDESIESQLKRIQDDFSKKAKANKARADLYNNFKI